MIFPQETSKRLLKLLLAQLSELELFPVMGAEIEFYLHPLDNTHLQTSWQAQKLDLDLNIETEKGPNQFEVQILYDKDIIAIAEKIIALRELISAQALKQNMRAIFQAKPILHQPGNALHFHTHLEDSAGLNLYIKQQDQETQLLLNSIGGLCHYMKEHILLFAPYENAYLRYTGDSLESPSKVCWGGNNRSASIRIPLDQKYNRRLEHRVACSDSCPFEVISAILFGILEGVKNNIVHPEKLYGNAFLEQYDFPLLPKNYQEALNLFDNSLLKKIAISL